MRVGITSSKTPMTSPTKPLTIWPSASRAPGTYSSALIDTRGYSAVHVFWDITGVGSGASTNCKVVSEDPLTEKYVTLYEFGPQDTVDTRHRSIGPGLETGKGLGDSIRIQLVVAVDNMTESVAIVLS